MNLLKRLAVLVAAVAGISFWPNGLTLVALFLTPLVIVLIEQADQPKPQRYKRTN